MCSLASSGSTEAPQIRLVGDDCKLDHATGHARQGVDEVVIPRLFIQEDYGIVKPFVELLFERDHGADRALYFAVASQHDNGSIRSATMDIRLHTFGRERLVKWDRGFGNVVAI